jgi:glutamate carboxypeptidase
MIAPASAPAVLPAPIILLPARAAELRATLIAWSEQNSGSDNFPGLAAMLTVLGRAFATLPGTVDEVPLADTPARALRVRVRPEAPLQLLISGHFDTVYSADHPFQRCTQLDANTLNGPGVADMKGGLIVMLATLQTFELTPAATRIGYEIILSADEEIGTHGTGPVLAAAAPHHHFGLVFEPARPDGSLVRTRMGTGSVLATCHGRAAHAAKAEDGRNAIAALAEFLVAAHRLPAELPGVLLNIGNIRGGGPATNIVPDFAESELDVRISRAGDDARLLSRLHELAAPINAREGFRLDLAPAFNRPPKGTGPAEAAAFAALQTAARDLGLTPFTWVDTGGGSDGNLLYAAGLPNLDGLGPLGDYLHSDRERVDLPSLVTRAQLSALFLHRLATGEIVLPR